jgi:hypothetical protein
VASFPGMGFLFATHSKGGTLHFFKGRVRARLFHKGS